MSRFAYAAAPSINVVFFAEQDPLEVTDDVRAVCDEADLVVALGNVDLTALAGAMPPDKPALCVLGGRDPERQPPKPFRALHGGGVTFKDWRVAGLSGASSTAGGEGFHVHPEEASRTLTEMPSCDLLLAHAPPSGLAHYTGVDPGLEALRTYIVEKDPIYCFHAHNGNDHVDEVIGGTWVVGVSGMLFPETLQFV